MKRFFSRERSVRKGGRGEMARRRDAYRAYHDEVKSRVNVAPLGRRNSGERVLFKLAHKLAYPVHACFTIAELLEELQTRRAVETEVLRLLL